MRRIYPIKDAAKQNEAYRAKQVNNRKNRKRKLKAQRITPEPLITTEPLKYAEVDGPV
jgi:hypothetical protein